MVCQVLHGLVVSKSHEESDTQQRVCVCIYVCVGCSSIGGSRCGRVVVLCPPTFNSSGWDGMEWEGKGWGGDGEPC